MPLETSIRRYEPKDKVSVRTLCADTAFLGNPIDPIFEDREVLADIIVQPYLDLDPDHSFVVDCEGVVVGYLTGSSRRDFEFRRNLKVLQTVAFKMLPRYSFGFYNKRSNKFVRWSLFYGWRQIPKHPEKAAHLHLNLDDDFRGLDLGKKLLEVFETTLRSKSRRHYYGEVFSIPDKRSESLYKRLGFRIHDKVENTMFYPEVQGPVNLVCIHKTLPYKDVCFPPPHLR